MSDFLVRIVEILAHIFHDRPEARRFSVLGDEVRTTRGPSIRGLGLCYSHNTLLARLVGLAEVDSVRLRLSNFLLA